MHIERKRMLKHATRNFKALTEGSSVHLYKYAENTGNDTFK